VGVFDAVFHVDNIKVHLIFWGESPYVNVLGVGPCCECFNNKFNILQACEVGFVAMQHVHNHVLEVLILLNALNKGFYLYIIQVCILFQTCSSNHTCDILVDVFNDEWSMVTIVGTKD
jgi:hypothetical protein